MLFENSIIIKCYPMDVFYNLSSVFFTKKSQTDFLNQTERINFVCKKTKQNLLVNRDSERVPCNKRLPIARASANAQSMFSPDSIFLVLASQNVLTRCWWMLKSSGIQVERTPTNFNKSISQP